MAGVAVHEPPDETADSPPAPHRVAAWQLLCERPLAYYCRDFMSSEECDAVIRLSLKAAGRNLSCNTDDSAKLRVDLITRDDKQATHECDENHADLLVLRNIERRVAGLCGLPTHGAEMPWAVHFTPSPLIPADNVEPPCVQHKVASVSLFESAPSPTHKVARSVGREGTPSRRTPAIGSSTTGATGSARENQTRMGRRSSAPTVASKASPLVTTQVEASASGRVGDQRMSLGLHVDTNNCRERRWLTFIAYLRTLPASAGGHTIFPLASLRSRGTSTEQRHVPKKLQRLAEAAGVLIRRHVHHTGQAANPMLEPEVQEASQMLLMQAERVASAAASRSAGPPACADRGGTVLPRVDELCFSHPSGVGVAVPPIQGSCVAFFTRSAATGGAIDPYSWHGGAAVTSPEGINDQSLHTNAFHRLGKWTLQKFKEAPPEKLRECCVESFAVEYTGLRQSASGGVQFGIEEREIC